MLIVISVVWLVFGAPVPMSSTETSFGHNVHSVLRNCPERRHLCTFHRTANNARGSDVDVSRRRGTRLHDLHLNGEWQLIWFSWSSLSLVLLNRRFNTICRVDSKPWFGQTFFNFLCSWLACAPSQFAPWVCRMDQFRRGKLQWKMDDSISSSNFELVWFWVNLSIETFFCSFTIDPFERHNTFNFVVGFGLKTLLTMGTHQNQVQRYSSVATEKQAINSIILSVPFNILCNLLIGATGLSIYAVYASCDPIKQVRKL